MLTSLQESCIQLIKLGIGTSKDVKISDAIDWEAIKNLADKQGLTAVVLDGLNVVHDSGLMDLGSMSQRSRLEWIGEVLQNYEQRYASYEKAISSLAGFYRQHGYKMMVLKGYACSLDWPNPKHRPCGDIDIWQFGKQKVADETLEKEKGVRIDNSHHHHTVFDWHGFMVENHYDFINIYRNRPNKKQEVLLKELGRDDSNYVMRNGIRIYLPSPNFHAFFLIRHMMGHFATSEITLRQVLDWAFFVKNHAEDVDWNWLLGVLDEYNMREFFSCINAICVNDLSFSATLFPNVQYLPDIKERILNDIIFPEFTAVEPKGFLPRVIYKYRRWKANGWKHKLCYKEIMWSAFWSGVWNHLLKPASI